MGVGGQPLPVFCVMRSKSTPQGTPWSPHIFSHRMGHWEENGHLPHWKGPRAEPPSHSAPAVAETLSLRFPSGALFGDVMMGTLQTPALFGSRNKGSTIVRREENKRVLSDLQVLKKAQDFPHAVIDLPDSIPIPMKKMEHLPHGQEHRCDQRAVNFGDGQQNGLAKVTGEEEQSSSSQS